MAAVILVLVAGYATLGPGSDEDQRVLAHVLDFEPGYTPPDGTTDIAWLGDAPIDPASPNRVLGSKAEPGLTYVAATGETGCRLPTDVELRRHGDRLYVRFSGGEDYEECYRPYAPFAQFSRAHRGDRRSDRSEIAARTVLQRLELAQLGAQPPVAPTSV